MRRLDHSAESHLSPDRLSTPPATSVVTAPALVTLSIVSHGQGKMVLPLLHQLNRFCSASIAKVIVTLNVPEPVFSDDLALSFPLETIVNSAAKGFGSNHNQAFSHCQTPWFLVLNPDIEIFSDVLAPLLDHAPVSAGLIAPLVQESDEAVATVNRDIITPWEVFAGQHLPLPRPERPVWFPGMFMLFRTDVFAAVKGFDERFHMYCEDFEISARIRLMGWELVRDQAVTVLHVAQRDSHVHFQYLLWHVASLLRLWVSLPFWRYWLYLKRLSR